MKKNFLFQKIVAIQKKSLVAVAVLLLLLLIACSTDTSEMEYLLKGNQSYYQGFYYSAIDEYTKIIEVNSNNHVGYYNRGLSYFYLKEYEKAFEDFKTADDLKQKLND